MSNPSQLSNDALEQIRSIDTCTLSNAIERFRLRLRNEGFANSGVTCRFPALPNIIGYAVTGRIRTYFPPMTGGWYYDCIDWFKHIQRAPEPRVIVVQDIDRIAGFGAFLGEIHANVYRALGCVAYVTNGAIRDLPALERLNLQVFAAAVSPSHAYAHLVDFDEPVEIDGCKICPGDLIHGDRHGIQVVPAPIVPELPRVAAEILKQESEIVALCKSHGFTLEQFASRIAAEESRDEPDVVNT